MGLEGLSNYTLKFNSDPVVGPYIFMVKKSPVLLNINNSATKTGPKFPHSYPTCLMAAAAIKHAIVINCLNVIQSNWMTITFYTGQVGLNSFSL